jgi:hypothetical protein
MQTSRSDCRRRRYLRWLSLLARLPPAPPMPLAPMPASGTPALWQRFRVNCGVADGVSLRLTHRDGHRIVVPLCDPYTLVGRAAYCPVRLEDPQLADVQAALIWAGGRLFLVDVARSSFGPVDTLPSLDWQWGSWSAEITGLPTTNEDHRKTLPADDDHPELVWQPPGPPRPTRLSRRLTIIGTAALCSVRLTNPEIAPLHAAFVRTAAAVRLVNLTSPHAAGVNGRAAAFAALDPGDSVTLGPVTATLTHSWSAADDSRVADAQTRLSEQQARIAEIELRLARLKAMTADNPQALQQLDAIEELAEQCEHDLAALTSDVSPHATAAAAATSAASPAPVRIHSASPE